MSDYLDINRANWDDRTAIHVDSPDYDLDRYRRDPDAISDVVRFDRPRLGDLSGLRALHLQCHIGTDTLSLHRLGAQVTGLDLSPAAVAAARSLAQGTGADIDYVVSDVYGAPGDQMDPHPDHPGEFRLADRPERLPASYTLRAVKEG